MLDFGTALQYLKDGRKVAREGWYGKHHLYLHKPGPAEPCNRNYIIIVTQKGDVIPWLASQADVLAEDWQQVE